MTDRLAKRYNLRPRVSIGVGMARDGAYGIQPFRFADLPAEIRNQIYKLTLTTDELVHLTLRRQKKRKLVLRLAQSYDSRRQCYRSAVGLNPKFLLVNKAIYFEGRPILYENKFYFTSPNTLFTFLSSLSPTFKSWIRDITFDFENPPFWNARKDFEYEYLHYLRPAFTALIGTTNLEHFHLYFDAESYEPCTGEEADSYTEEEADSDIEYKEDFRSKFYEDAYLWLEELVRQKGSKEKAVKMIDISLRPEEGSSITGMDSRTTSILHERLNPDEFWGLSEHGGCVYMPTANLEPLHLGLYLSVVESHRWTLDSFATTLFSLSHLWLEARTRQKGSREKAVELIDLEVVVEDISEYADSESESSRVDYDKDWTASELRKELVQKLCYE